MAHGREKPVFISVRGWVRERLLARLRSVDQSVVSDAALKALADTAARRLTETGMAYGAVTQAMFSIDQMFKALDEAGATAPINAAGLKRLRQSGVLPDLFPWF